MKKIFLIFTILIFLSGCSVDYEININKDTIEENINVLATSELDSENILEYKEPIPAFIDSMIPENPEEKYPDVEYYSDNKNIDEYGNYKLNLKYNFSKKDYLDNYIINLTASNFYYILENDELKISAGSYLKAFERYTNLDNINVKINISDDYEIINSNATFKEGNTLNWQINRENYKTSIIYLNLKEKGSSSYNPQNPIENINNNQNNNQKEEVNNERNVIIAVLGILFFILILIIILSLKNKLQNNK